MELKNGVGGCSKNPVYFREMITEFLLKGYSEIKQPCLKQQVPLVLELVFFSLANAYYMCRVQHMQIPSKTIDCNQHLKY